ncbi:glycosyltransferase family 2 protein [Methylotetracoccus oryzae]|uniref:glycosyltransferase family 2 protein n=1 Tax=Methylotetracoccus oryzae TaxID=1919059 RepID=UPI0013A56354|nr:glycosyltransferase family 2 protein [Methylotetracoccus oryzae]
MPQPTVKISLVTAVRNAMPWVQETVRSVVTQDYPGLEYIVIDGASTDGTLDYLKSQAQHFSVLRSEADDGQYAAIAKGMACASGDVLGWINGDDVLMPWTLRVVARIFEEFPEVDWISGLPAYLNTASECYLVSPVAASYPRRYIANGWFREGLLGYLMQETMFWRRSLWERAGGLDLQWRWAGDFDLWVRFAALAELTAVATPLAAFRIRGEENRSRQGSDYRDEVARRCASLPAPPASWRLASRLGKAGEALLRSALWSRTPVVAHSLVGDRWRLLRTRRPVSRNDLPRLLLEHALRSRHD